MNRLLAASLLITVFAPGIAFGSSQGIVAEARWKAMDNCAKQAQLAFPDHTAEANAKREASLQQCLAGQGLPPRETYSPGR